MKMFDRIMWFASGFAAELLCLSLWHHNHDDAFGSALSFAFVTIFALCSGGDL